MWIPYPTPVGDSLYKTLVGLAAGWLRRRSYVVDS